MMKNIVCFVVQPLMVLVLRVPMGNTNMVMALTNAFIVALPPLGLASKVPMGNMRGKFYL